MTKNNDEHRWQELPKQFDYIKKAETLLMTWATANDVKLFRVEFVVPFVLTDKSVSVWLFFDTEELVAAYEANGITQKVKDQYLIFLNELDYPEDYLNEVSFYVDSDEHVKKYYQGSYFYRLR